MYPILLTRGGGGGGGGEGPLLECSTWVVKDGRKSSVSSPEGWTYAGLIVSVFFT